MLMAFKSAANRGAYFEKLRQKGGMTPGMSPASSQPNPASKLNTLPELNSLSKAPKAQGLPGLPKLPSSPMAAQPKPIGSFEKLKRSIKMPKVGF